MPLVIISLGILFLFLLIIVFRLNAFIAFILVSIAIGIGQGMELNAIVSSIEKGIGNTLGFLVMILGLGAMLGKLVAESGAAQKITNGLISLFGIKNTRTAVMLTGFIVGITMFYSVGFVILVPLVFTVATATGLSLISIALPMLAALSVTHGFLPPHPAPSALSIMFEADLGKTLIYGIVVAIPAIIISGPVLTRFIPKVDAKPLKEFMASKVFEEDELPSLSNSLITALLPVILIGFSTVIGNFIATDHFLYSIIKFIGNPVIALLLTVLIGIYTLGIARGNTMEGIMKIFGTAVSGITMVLLIISGAGALKQILIDSGVSNYIGSLLELTSMSPLIIAWLIATLIRFSVGSATVAGLTTAGIVLPLVQSSGVSPELMVLAIGSGSLMLSHVNDSGFWLFKEYFNLSVKETLSTWTVMETSIGITGLLGVLILENFI
ncbi:gluconate:H+ symporter [Flavobacteriaceae bacterium]|jgi:Gnt-I system high-affinity gluconate transporter|nr:gluconate:H+ symporter [Flavobacteriaceae bacterium]MDA9811685.1 gluconate:H+ symporter [Flavobacteriaceae bacterium]MDB2695442.1 gluconate:H+ symporter [Flavobacteriaceae bacterium]MDB4285028.1 gluconate:H+ symporter [Flavobacteriaceae bacterium]MDC1542183.1 gluconate:H+ symporter [Flavobacteriaceae bacterium]